MRMGSFILVFCLTALAAAAETVTPGLDAQVVPDLDKPPVFATEAALTAGECRKLGGKVYSDRQLCNSGRYCGTTDEDGERHRVCLEAKK